VWSADFVFDQTAEGRVLKCLTIVDDATTEAVAVVPARAWRPAGNARSRVTRHHAGGLTPAAYAQQLTARTKAKVTAGF
jgi:hypothetical protein